MDINALKLKYQSCKLKVKQWEDDFMRNNGKIPTKDDIRNASQSVRHAYKRYHTLKIELLQATRNKVPTDAIPTSETQTTNVKSSNENLGALTSVSKVLSFEDGSQSEQPVDEVLSNVFNALQKIHSDNKNVKPTVNNKPKKEIIPVYNSHLSAKELNSKLQSLKSQVLEDTTDAPPTKVDDETVSEVPADPDMPENVKDAWGSHLNKQQVAAPKSKVRNFRERTASFQLTEKLFGKSQFKSKRNPLKPRIPLRRSKSECFSLLSNSCDDSNSISASEVVNSQPTPEPLPVEHDADQDPFSFDLFSESKCKVVIKDSSSKSSQTSILSRSLIMEPKHSLDLGWIARCTGTTDSSPLVDFAAQMQEDITRQSAVVKKDHNIPKTSNETPTEKHVPKSSTQTEHNEMASQLDVIPRNVSRSPEIFTSVEPDPIPSSDNDNEIVSDSDTETPQLMKKRQAEDILSPLLQCKKKAKVTKIPSSMMTQQDKLEKKISEGRINENFVKINLKKKIFVRGRKNTSYTKYKKMMYKKKQVGGSSGGGGGKGNCFKCGEPGHWANKCPNAGGLMPSEEADEIDDSPYLTLEEAGALADENKPVSRFAPLTDTQSEATTETTGVTTDSQATEGDGTEAPRGPIQPLYPRPETEEDGYLIDTPLEVWQALKQFGHSTFRPGQEEAIMRILSGMSTLVMLSTGAGKSLCYQLPAYLYAKRNEGCIVLVVSPLVSLMEDQVENLPKPLRGACLHMNQSAKQREQVEEKLKEGQLHVLLVSPETIVQSERQGGLGGILKHLPPIAFACIDEAHCVSQWSHNFRPAYLMLCKVLRERLKIRTVLGLTATATGPTAKSIAEHLDVPDGRVISDMPMPSNLVLSVSRDDKRDVALIKLLQGERFSACDSIIIYCIRREECERIAGLLRTCLQDSSKRESSKRRALSWNSEAYHAGLTPFRRKQVQQAFMSGKLRIVVATVAFGMGINKNNLRAVIHYNMPSSFERFVQEVGRAGRDGLPAHCHLFLDSQGKDLNELRRHIYSDSTDRHILRKLLLRVFKSCKCKNAVEKLENWDPEKECQETSGTQESPRQVQCPGHEVAFLTEETVQALDLPEENILTLLCYLELHPKRWLEVLSPAYVTCKVSSYGGSAALKAATKKCPPLAMAVALDQKAGISHEKSTSIEFPVVDVASAIGWDSGQAKRQLKQLEWRKVNDKYQRSSLVVQLSGPGLRVRAKGCLPPEDLDEALDWLMARVERQENSKLLQLEALFLALTNISYSNCDDCLVDVDMAKCDVLKEAVKKYFDSDENEPGELKLLPGVTNEDQVRANVCSMVSTFTDTSFTGRAIARIFHGIASPGFQPYTWGKTRFWRLHLNDNFTALCKIASSELLRLRT